MRSLISLAVTAGLLAACITSPSHTADPARFDFNSPTDNLPPGYGVADVEVSAPTWLATGAMQYRLNYADRARRFDYADSRWVAPAPELLSQALDRRLAGPTGGRCRLRIELDEFIQVFETPTSSKIVLAGRAILNGSAEIGRRSFSFAQAAATPDASGGVTAATTVVKTLGDELAAWIGQAEACR